MSIATRFYRSIPEPFAIIGRSEGRVRRIRADSSSAGLKVLGSGWIAGSSPGNDERKRVVPEIQQRKRSGGMPISKKSGLALVAGIADERFLLSAEQDQNRRNNGEHQPDRLIEN